MTTKRIEFPKLAKGGAAFFLCWLAGFGVSYLLIYSRFRWPDNRLIGFFLNQIFFYIQTALPQSIITDHGGGDDREILSGWLLKILSILYWLAVGVAFAWFARRMRLYFMIPLAAVSVFFALMSAELLLALFRLRIDVLAP
jgi:hypothetical protein